MGKIQKIRNELMRCENLHNHLPDICKQMHKSQQIINMISRNMEICNADYRELLMECVDHISVSREQIAITAVGGDFSLPRIPRDQRQTHLMPYSLLKKKKADGKEFFEVTFYCENKTCRQNSGKILAEWENLKITTTLTK